MTDKELIQALRKVHDAYFTPGVHSHSIYGYAADRLEALLALNEALNERDEASKELVQALERKNAALERNVQLLKDQIPKWRPVSEPPEEYCRCLALLESGEICDVEFEVDCNNTFGIWQARYDYDTLGFLDSEWYEIETVTHWMPLPSTEGVE